MSDEYLTLVQIAELVDVKELSMRLYHNQAERRRREGCPRYGDFVEPDVVIGNSPRWAKSSVEAWMLKRPGRGVRKNS